MKTFARAAFLVAVVFSCAMAAWAQDPIPPIDETYPNALGFSFGTNVSPVSLFNLHYQRWLGAFGFDVSIGAAKDFFGAGTWGADGLASFLYRFSSGNLTEDGNLFGSLYGFARSGFVAQQRVDSIIDDVTYEYRSVSVYYQYIPVAVGVGIEAVFFKHLSLPLEVGFEYRVLTQDFGPTFSGGLRYRF